MSAMKLTAEHNQLIPYVVSKFGHLAVYRKTGDVFIWTEWVGFDSVDGTMEPPYAKSHGCSRNMYRTVPTKAMGSRSRL
jgi:hypothetical protein